MQLMTRDTSVRPYGWTGAELTAGCPAAGYIDRVGLLARGGALSVKLPPGGGPGYGYAVDPSDPSTWRRPLIFT